MREQTERHASNVGQHFAKFAHRDWERPAEGGPIRFAVIGIGGFARNRALPSIRAVADTEATVLVSSSAGKAADVAEEYGAERVLDYDAFHAGEATDAYDAAYVATPNKFHRKYAESAAKFGKHVLCEKPLAASVADAEAMVEACESAGVTLMTAYRLHVEPAVRRTRDIVQDGCIGRPVQIHSDFSTKLLDGFGPDHWRLDPEIAGGGAMLDIGVYPLNAARFILDEDPVAVQAVTNSWDDAFDGVDEHVAFQMAFPNGVVASCSATFDGQPNSQFRIVGTEGSISIESPYGGDIPQEIVVQCGDMSMEYTGSPVDEVTEEVAYFANHVLTDRRPGPDGHDGLYDMRVADAVYESAETGERVSIGE
jgi:xylose dehydrogenase (NAD/NADP)